jgi:DinB family protein
MMRPEPNEAAPYYFNYINLVPEGDIVDTLEKQLEETSSLLSEVSEEKSLERYAPDKWSLRELLNHVNDTERLFVFRALWFARGFTSPLPSFDQEIAVKGAGADQLSWASQVEEFRSIRSATLAFFRGLPKEAWDRSGIASDNPFTVRALAYIAAGHVKHHSDVVRDRYLAGATN